MKVEERKFKSDLIEYVARNRKHGAFRFYIAAYLMDATGDGWVDKTTFVPFIANHFEISEKTVKNNLNKLHSMGWGDNTPDRFYYRSQEKVLTNIESSRNKAVYINLSQIKGGLVSFRAFNYECVLAGRQRDQRTIIARDTLREAVAGHSKTTQRKYEKIQNIQKTTNFALLEGDDKLELTYENGQPVFMIRLNGENRYVRQLPNSYVTVLRIGKRCRANHGINLNPTPSDLTRLYFSDGRPVKSSADNVFCETTESVNGGSLWLKKPTP